jgi:error-prone DNA polymerase
MLQVAGLVLVRQRPGSASGVIFATIEDETGVANIIVWPRTFEKYRSAILGSRCLGVRGRLQKEDNVIHLVAYHLHDLTPMLADISAMADEINCLANADEVRRPQMDMRTKIKTYSRLTVLSENGSATMQSRQAAKSTKKALPKGRNFH